MAEMGSTSLQLAFQVDESANTEKHISHIDLHNGKKLNLYEYSYLCYGDAEINRRIQAQLVKVGKRRNIFFSFSSVLQWLLA